MKLDRSFVALLVPLLLAQTQIASAKVKVELLTQDVHAGMPFQVRLSNDQSRSISFCIDLGQTVGTETERRPAPNPFYLQRWTGKEWDTQLIGTDVGNGPSLETMGWREAEDFQIQVNTPGTYRLQLQYSNWSFPDCASMRKHSSRVNSATFEIH